MKGYGTTRLRYGHLTYIAQILVFFKCLKAEEERKRRREREKQKGIYIGGTL
jgi:hypothetical protein